MLFEIRWGEKLKKVNAFLKKHSLIIGVWASITTILSFFLGYPYIQKNYLTNPMQINGDESIIYNGTVYHDTEKKLKDNEKIDRLFKENKNTRAKALFIRNYINSYLENETGFYIDFDYVYITNNSVYYNVLKHGVADNNFSLHVKINEKLDKYEYVILTYESNAKNSYDSGYTRYLISKYLLDIFDNSLSNSTKESISLKCNEFEDEKIHITYSFKENENTEFIRVK